MKNFTKFTLLTAMVLPMLASAQGVQLGTILGTAGGLLTTILRLLFLVALVVFVWGVIRFVISSDADDKEKARGVVVKGIIGLFVIVSVWGLVGLVQETLGVGTGGRLNNSQLPGVDINNF